MLEKLDPERLLVLPRLRGFHQPQFDLSRSMMIPVPRAALSDSMPLSPLQEGMVFDHMLRGRGSGVDIEQVLMDTPEELNRERLEASFSELMAAHELFRMGVEVKSDGGLLGRISSTVHVPVLVPDMPAERTSFEEAFEAFLRTDRKEGFDLSDPPLHRLALFRKPDGGSRLVWTVHHLLVDGRTFEQVLGEWFDRMDFPDSGTALPAPGLKSAQDPGSTTYRDYVRWTQTQDPESSKSFWSGLMSGADGPGPIPGQGFHDKVAPGPSVEDGSTDSPPELGAPLSAREAVRTLGPEVVDRLRDVAKDLEVTPNSLVQAAWVLLLGRAGETRPVTFGQIRSGRYGTVEGAGQIVGPFIRTLPMVQDPFACRTPAELARELRRTWVEMRDHEHVPLSSIREWSGVSAGEPLFHSVLNVQDPPWTRTLASRSDAWSRRRVHVRTRLAWPLMMRVELDQQSTIRAEFNPQEVAPDVAARAANGLADALEAMVERPHAPLAEIPTLDRATRDRLHALESGPAMDVGPGSMVTERLARQAVEHPDREAIRERGANRGWTWAELEARSRSIAHRLVVEGVRPGARVGVALPRSNLLVAALWGVMRAGAAWVPLDPQYPPERLRTMLEAAGLECLLVEPGQADARAEAEAAGVRSVEVSRAESTSDPAGPDMPPLPEIELGSLAYVLFTSGSSGAPKGVRVDHRNLANFLGAMDERLGPSLDVGTSHRWLAATSISFDISILELFWTLARGVPVVVHGAEVPNGASGPPKSANAPASEGDDPHRPVSFGLFYFATGGAEEDGSGDPPPGRDRYRLLLDGARRADELGFGAIWMPERHFHAFGGIFPNPSVTGAAVAAVTEQIRIRSGSVVLPLHDPLRVAEEWAVVDNLSDGRVDLSFASGWHDRDFVFRPHLYDDRKEHLFRQIDTLRALWRGEPLEREVPGGGTVQVTTHPRPVQPELPVWVTAGGSPDTFRKAGEIGANLLTHLLGQSPDDVRQKVALYREARREAGHEGPGTVSLMLHTYVGESEADALDRVRAPFRSYLRSSVGLISGLVSGRGDDLRQADLSEDDMEALLDHAFQRYVSSSALVGTVEECVERARTFASLGVDEFACLVDFGVDETAVLAGVDRLGEVMRVLGDETGVPATRRPNPSVAEALLDEGITHFQCTPSQARLLLAEPEGRQALGGLQGLLVGGEACPVPLARELQEVCRGTVLSMYGPTESTIWSGVQPLDTMDDPEPLGDGDTVPLGDPIANTILRVADPRGGSMAPGAAGELVVGGLGVARGYLDDPKRTAAHFEEGDERYYRTGDWVRRDEWGRLRFLGRLDRQVKVRGHRLELGEIEAHLSTCPVVASGALVARPSDADDLRLVAFVVPRDAASTTDVEAAVRRHLRARLPEAGVPGTIRCLEALPLTPNGKLDRGRLPDVEPEATASTSVSPVSDASRTEMEDLVARVWADLLDRKEVDRDANFFDLGGHSLLTIRVRARLAPEVDGTLTLADLFTHPTVRQLAAHLSRLRQPEGDTEDVVVSAARERARARRRVRGDASELRRQDNP